MTTKSIVFIAIYLVVAIPAMTFLHDKVPGISGIFGGFTAGWITQSHIKRNQRKHPTCPAQPPQG
ncbi:hypothetical protein V5P93_000889 [Actinokineospora auranticolor]|uniref:Uncharacterized protein n=1 Tax=Actinokineospora auranticolor TaxID=155976 RepID=A0A2S6GYC9_9PSEU|nr:hypothetical protein [Actinokineospora auranticolor]PPK70233.1 hypothetical protein CLV40_102144 [Actinokineospora auranticolor]